MRRRRIESMWEGMKMVSGNEMLGVKQKEERATFRRFSESPTHPR